MARLYEKHAFLPDCVPEILPGTAFMEEAGADRFEISDLPFVPSGVLAHVLRSDDVAIAVDGTYTNGKAVVTLDADCYHVAGRLSVAIYITDASMNSQCVYACVGNVYRTVGDTELDSGTEVPTLAQLEAAYQACISATQQATNAVSYVEQTGKTDAQKAQARANIGAPSEDDLTDLRGAIQQLLDTETVITSVNKLDANSAIGKTASQINGQSFYFGMEKTLADYADNLSVIVFCHTTTDSINGLTAQWLYRDGTTASDYITLNSSYRVDQISSKENIVGIKFVAYSVGANLIISKLGVKFTGNTSTSDEDTYAEGAVSERLNNIEDRLDSMNIYVYDDSGSVELTTGDGVMSVSGQYNTSIAQFKHATGTIVAGNHYKISGRTFGASYPVYLWLDSNNAVVGYGTATDASDITEIGIAPTGATKVCINLYDGHNTPSAILGVLTNTQEYIDDKVSDAEKTYWTGKKIVWFGTSIPAGVINDGDSGGVNSYPVQIGEMLGATVYNEAIGGSAVRAGDEHAITADDPMGYGGMSAPGLMLSLSLSSSEKQAIFDNWDTKWKDIITYNQNLINVSDPTYTNMYKNSSWDILLAKYLTGGAVGQCDLYVFDHGYNDGVKTYGFEDLPTVPSTANDRTYFVGAMTFLIEKILADNPNACICFIGHWSNDKGTGNNSTLLVAQGQEKIAEIWKYPLCKTWDKIGWSANTISSNGVTKPVYQFWCLDGVHPASDTSGKALRHYAETLLPFIRDVR